MNESKADMLKLAENRANSPTTSLFENFSLGDKSTRSHKDKDGLSMDDRARIEEMKYNKTYPGDVDIFDE